MGLNLHSLLSFMLLLFVISVPVSEPAISPGSSLSASNLNGTWSSPNNNFFLGFFPSTSATSSPSFFAAISYFRGVHIWSVGGGATVDSAGTLQFLANGNLRLVDGSGNITWQSGTASLGVSSASLDDSGNFVLLNGSSPVWSSFALPTDTIVTGQNLTVGMILQSGSYSFTLLKTGNLTLKWDNNIIYWNQGMNSSVNVNLTSPHIALQSVGIISIFDNSLPTELNLIYSSDFSAEGPIMRFLKLDSDGNLRIYSDAGDGGNGTETWVALSNKCLIFGYCGNYGICSYNEKDAICGCPTQNFLPVDPNDMRKGCKRKVELENCPGNGTAAAELENTQFLTYPPEAQQMVYAGRSACRLNCLSSAACFASTSLSDGSGQCSQKTTNLVSGYQSPTLPSSSYVKVCDPVIPNPSTSSDDRGEKGGLAAWVVVIVVIGTVLVLIVCEGSLWWWCCRNNPKFGAVSSQYALLEYASGAPIQFSYKELHRLTKGFKEKLGVGGFGAVYRGILSNRTVVAVKQLEGIEQGEKQFRMEVATISSTHHLNLVRLIGFCSEGRRRLLVYEFMKNGSLDSFLFKTDENSRKFLNWAYRFNIAIGTARGITYLHEECRDCIIHCDIKPENILVDDNFDAKVSDFGLAKLINPKDHRYKTLSSVRGTRGYLGPEWLANLPLTSKSDVYSYGMVLLEIVSGRRNYDISAETNHKKFSIWSYEEFEKGNIMAIIDKRLAEEEINMEQVLRAIKVSFWCIQEQPSQRPNMGKVVQMLEGIREIEKPPAPNAAPELSTMTSAFSMSAPSGHTLSSSSSEQVGGTRDPPSQSLLRNDKAEFRSYSMGKSHGAEDSSRAASMRISM